MYLCILNQTGAIVLHRNMTEGITWPVIDGHVLPDDQYKMYEAKRFNDTPILVGYNSDEGLSFGVPPRPTRTVRPRATLRPIRGPAAGGLSHGSRQSLQGRRAI
jgi:carboxylesterase type B